MQKKPLNKIRIPFLEGSFSENPLPYKRLNKKGRKISLLSNKKGVTRKISNIKKNIIKCSLLTFSKNNTFAVPTSLTPPITSPKVMSVVSVMSGKGHNPQRAVSNIKEKNSLYNYSSVERYQALQSFIKKGILSKTISKTIPFFVSKIEEYIPSFAKNSYGPHHTPFRVSAAMSAPESKNRYIKNTEKPCITATKYMFSLEQFKAELHKKQSQYKKSSHFKNVLLERKKCSLIYGSLGEKQMQKLILQAKHFDGKFDENFIKIVESRLDVALYRICFFPTIFSAKQWIYHGHVLVNKKVVSLPGYQLKAGDVISISPEKNTLLKKKISSLIAKKLRISSTHYFVRISLFYTVIKNLVKYQNKNFSLYLSIFTHNNVSVDFAKNSLYQTKRLYLEESRKVVSFFKKSFRIILQTLHNYKIHTSLELLPKVYPFFSLLSSLKIEKCNTLTDPLVKPISIPVTSLTSLTDPLVKPKVMLQVIYNEGGVYKNEKIFSIFYPFLKVKNLFTSARSEKQRLNTYKITGMKPLNIEVCYKNMIAIFLYSPQKVALPTTLDFSLIEKGS